MNIRKFDLVVALYIFGVMVAELMGAKTFPLTQFSWLHLNATVAIFVMPLLFTLTDIVVEVHGRKRARSMVFSGLITVFLLLLFGLLATSLPPSVRFAGSEAAYDAIFKASTQIAFASIVAFAASELLDVAVFSKLRKALGGRALWLRNNVSNFVSQLIDSTVFVVLAFYAFSMSPGDNASFLVGIIIPYWLIRCALSVFETPLVYLGVWWLKGDTKPSKVELAKETA
ncbi:MAG TPA: queuosine precursor transporter [Nevskiaceae bacterium]|nr:queuosine precursor transporter [Nevskiaceae bacterium]